MSFLIKDSHYKLYKLLFLPIFAYDGDNTGIVYLNISYQSLSTLEEVSVETLMEELKSVTSKMNELEPQEEKHEYETVVIFSKSSLH